MLELTEDTLVDTIFFVGGQFPDGSTMDWLGHVSKQPGEPWRMEYRFRYHEDDKDFDSDDRKSWYAYVNNDPAKGPEELVQALQMVALLTCKQYEGELWILEVKGNGMAAKEMLEQQPWCHMKEAPLEPGN
jgi:hypothetical protein